MWASKQLSDQATAYETALSETELSMSTAGANKLEHYDLIYAGGLMATLALDLAIIEQTQGRHRLADVLPQLHVKYSDPNSEGLGPESLARLIAELTGADVQPMLLESVRGRQRLPTVKLLSQVALGAQ